MKRFPRRSITQVMVLGVALLALSAGCSKDDTTTNPPDNNGTVTDAVRPVVFAHGQYEAADAWIPFSQLFSLNNYTEDQINAFDFEDYLNGTGEPDIPKMASQLQSKIASVLQKTGADRVDIIAHGAGAKAVQHYLTKLEGTKSVAHVAYVGGIFDQSLKLNGSLIPGPCKYITVRSDGKDATQGGDGSNGSLSGAENRQAAGKDHQELLYDGDTFAGIYKYFTGQDASVIKLPGMQFLRTYYIKGRVVSLIDNTPIPNATVRFLYISIEDASRQSNGTWRIIQADANGYFSFVDTLRPISMLEIHCSADGYHESHIYRQRWRYDSRFERVRLFPKSGGSPYLQSVMQTLVLNQQSALTLIHSPYRAIYNSRDQIAVRCEIDEPSDRIVNVVNPKTGPDPNSGYSGSNTMMMFLFDFGSNQIDGTGPIPGNVLNRFGINSYDVFLDATRAGLYSSIKLNNDLMYFRNWRSLGTAANNQGVSIVQFDYFQ